ncbi:plasmid replication protein, CyRepA1 family [Coleofasciculus sp. FACHB-SPT9]|uniref:plasmid replication protein, CyRepA1 family n=1 Tax=Cyanophyceae TaxID=3028117 RepID=UPI001684DD27|nr:plasmid replication protein, CyRepA1 family [Coleofasciculus sp. FACHB-SPT9]MBD1890487.1 DUF3854 domain-containing protein [Coleofasciculus sp. FACHB-SPT9]
MIHPLHLEEWRSSGVDDAIIKLNVRSLSGYVPHERLLYSDKLERLNTGRVASWMLYRYAHTEKGGWWCSGLDPLDDWQAMLWGAFKPDQPRRDDDGKLQKYEHPPKTETRVFYLRVSLSVWEAIATRYGVPMPEEVSVTEDVEAAGFWAWLLINKIPLGITEGVKKAAALLSAGFAAIALPGITSGYRQPKDEFGTPVGTRQLIPELAIFQNHPVYFAFDHDVKRKTVRAVGNAIHQTGSLLLKQGCQVSVVTWDEPQKGVDDFLVANGVEAFEKCYESAQPLEEWRSHSYNRLMYPTNVSLNQKYLGELTIPKGTKLIGIKSPKGSGKTESLAKIAADAAKKGKWVLVLSHRVQLGQALCRRLGVPYVTEVRDCETGKLLGFGLCVDSLHPNSQAQFRAENWRDGIVILDECEQVVWHLLNSKTCQSVRVPILREFKILISNALTSQNGQVILSDADLSDVTLDYIQELAGVNTDPWIVENTHKSEGCNVYNYLGTNPSRLIAQLEEAIGQDEKVFICCSGQKTDSRFGTRILEARLAQQFPKKRILRIDSESVSDPNHAAFGCTIELNEVLDRYDIVIASPSLETGVSIDIENHFDSVWAILQGVVPENSARQALARVRESVDRHIWVAAHGLGKIGNGSTNPKSLLASQRKLAKANIQLLKDVDFEDLDTSFDAPSLRAWVKMAVRINSGMIRYRESVLAGLKAEGHKIIDIADGNGDETLKALNQVRDTEHQKEAEAIASAASISQSDFEKLKEKRSKTQEERCQERKHSLALRYGVDVAPDLVIKDDDNWHPQLQMHYYLAVGREYLPARDKKRLDAIKKQGEGAAWMPDLNRSLISSSIAALENLGVLALLDTQRDFKGTDDDLQAMAQKSIAARWQIKTALDIGINEKDSPIVIAQKLLGKLGLRLTFLRKEGARGEQQRVYKFLGSDDGREEVFAAWLARDEAARQAEAQNVSSCDTVVTPGNKEYLKNSPDYQTPQTINQGSAEDAPSFTAEDVRDAADMVLCCDNPEAVSAVLQVISGFCCRATQAIWALIPREKEIEFWELAGGAIA